MNNKLIYDKDIFNLETLIEIYDDNSVEIVNDALLGFVQASVKKITKLEIAYMADDLVDVSLIAHSLSGLCRFCAVTKLGRLSDQLSLAAKNNDKLKVSKLIAAIHAHWPILEKQIKYIVKNYRDIND